MSTVPIVMTGLSPNTNYEIQVSFDNSDWSPSEEERFITKSASATLPIVSAIERQQHNGLLRRVIAHQLSQSRVVIAYWSTYSWKTEY